MAYVGLRTYGLGLESCIDNFLTAPSNPKRPDNYILLKWAKVNS